MALSEEATFPSKWFFYSFLVLSGLAIIMSVTHMTGWIMWFFPLYVFFWSRGLQNDKRGLRKKG